MHETIVIAIITFIASDLWLRTLAEAALVTMLEAERVAGVHVHYPATGPVRVVIYLRNESAYELTAERWRKHGNPLAARFAPHGFARFVHTAERLCAHPEFNATHSWNGRETIYTVEKCSR